MNPSLPEVIYAMLPWLGGAAGMALLGMAGNVYHGWWMRRQLRRILEALERVEGRLNNGREEQ